MATTHEPLYLDKQSLVQWKIMDILTSFIWIIIFFNGPFEYGDGGIFKLLRWMQNIAPVNVRTRNFVWWQTFIRINNFQ